MAANGIDINSGSAVDVSESAREEGKLNTEQTNANAQLQAYGYRTQAANFTAQSKLDQAASENAMTGAELSAGGGLLANASAIGIKSPQFSNDISGLFTAPDISA